MSEPSREDDIAFKLCDKWQASMHRQRGFAIDELSAFMAGVKAALRAAKPEPRRMYDPQNGDRYVVDAAGNAYEPAAKPERERVIEFALQPFIDGLSGTEAAKMIDKRYPGLSPIQIVVTKFQYQAAKDALKGTPA